MPPATIMMFEQRFGWLRGPQNAQSPHGALQAMITWSPAWTLVTPSPTSETMPAPSWPRTQGGGLRDGAVQDRQVRVAHARRLDLHLHLTRTEVDELDVVPDLDLVVADVANECSAHVSPWVEP